MARKKINNEALTLDTLIPQFAENKSLMEDYKKICETENKQIKELMTTNEYETGGYRAVKITSTRESINEDKLLDVLKNCDAIEGLNIIKTKEYVDTDALESAIYKGAISKDVLLEIDKCRDTKEVVTLRVTKVKEKK